MEISHLKLPTSRGMLPRLLLFTLIIGCIGLYSCEDDMSKPSSNVISFTTSIGSSWKSESFSADSVKSTVQVIKEGEAPLYLHTISVDSIASPDREGLSSRATPIDGSNMYTTFGVSAYSYTDSWNENLTANEFYNIEAKKSGGRYALSSVYFWPDAPHKLKVFAYAPKDNPAYVLSPKSRKGSPRIKVSIPSDVSNQQDLLAARTDELSSSVCPDVDLSFNHILTAVKFECGDDMQGGVVKSISLKDVFSNGEYNMESQQWENTYTPNDFTQTLDKTTTGAAGEALTAEAQTFMMLPQTLPSAATIEVVFADKSGQDNTLRARIGGTKWTMGSTITYKISSSSINWTYHLDVTQPADFPWYGDRKSFEVRSYRINGLGRKEPIPWTASFSVDDGVTYKAEKPEWLTKIKESGSGSTSTWEYVSTTVAHNIDMDNTTPQTLALRAKTPKGTESAPYNLSNQSSGGTAVENTANAYVVDAPGYYSIPLVYGNAIKNSATNESSYKTNNTSDIILRHFINHTGNPITSPYIKENADCVPAKAELLWQDAYMLVTDINYDDTDKGRITFKVDAETIKEGNAVICVKNEADNILWSWHIWISNEDMANPVALTNHDGEVHKIMRVDLGWCNKIIMAYPERKCIVKITANGQSKEVIVKQTEETIKYGDNVPFYQWGRKDPFLPLRGELGVDDQNKTWYDKNGRAYVNRGLYIHGLYDITPPLIPNCILKPTAVYYARAAVGSVYANLWSMNTTKRVYHGYIYNGLDSEHIKTIYDPSPVGYKVPLSKVFTGFYSTIDYNSTVRKNNFNGVYNEDRIGWDVYTNPSKTETVFFPLSGRRVHSTQMFAPGKYSVYWMAILMDKSAARRINLYKPEKDQNNTIVIFSGSDVSDCRSIRPSQDTP